MNKYYVLAKVVTESRQKIEIEANSKSEAKLKAKELINSGSYMYLSVGGDETIEIMRVDKNG
ncbi:hypothetical protein GA0061081_102240 [Gilliamella bombicola]|uniref:Uncharacterized protein n=1 Tax=Gilliamella bombicola TaxID=1798182 RepID=A0A1C4A540_9GAMM|nr:hypothetical protein [Gilliamella bombicola]SCB89675.1 hypothetical protein GA0061081_102240 [Gilliamella bombicola]